MGEETQRLNESEYINFQNVFTAYMAFFRRRWWLIIPLLLCTVGIAVTSIRYDKSEIYTSTVYYSLEKTSNIYTDASVASRAAAGVTYVSRTSDFKEEIKAILGEKYLGNSYAFYGIATESANLFSVTVQCSDSEYANELIKAFEEVYPAWLNRTMGQTMLTIMDEELSDGDNQYYVSVKRKILLGIFAAIAIWFVLATLKVLLSHKVEGESDMAEITDSTCYGILPNVVKKQRDKSKKETLLVENSHIDLIYLQAVRSLAAKLEGDIARNNKKVIMITSTLPEEGKSLLVTNLATIMQHHNKDVIVVDGDFRKCGISATVPDAEKQTGVSDYLMGKESKIFLCQLKSGVRVLPTGTIDSNVSINSKRLKNMFATLKQNADVILVDTPPTGAFSDAVTFSEYVDGVVYVVRGNHAELSDIRRGMEPFIVNRSLMGYVLNRISSNHTFYGRAYGYGSGYSKYRNYGSSYGKYGSHYGESDNSAKSEE